MARQKPSSHYNPVVQLEATEELFVITRYNQSPKRKRGVFDRSRTGRWSVADSPWMRAGRWRSRL